MDDRATELIFAQFDYVFSIVLHKNERMEMMRFPDAFDIASIIDRLATHFGGVGEIMIG